MKAALEKLGLPLVHRLDPEFAHGIALKALRAGLTATPGPVTSSRLRCSIAGLDLPNPVGLAAGFDKNAKYFDLLHLLGFGFVEIGTVTPRPQAGNPKPRLFRLKEDTALINRMGFNNEGLDAVVERLKKGRLSTLILGGNIGKNKDTPNDRAVDDYLICFEKLHPWVDYFVVNVSSPNTPGLRELQEKAALTHLLETLATANKTKETQKPIFLKIAPDMSEEQFAEISDIVNETEIAGVIGHNTTIDRSGLRTSAQELDSIGAGGLSGQPLAQRSDDVLSLLASQRKGSYALVSSGGITAPHQAKQRIKSGADLVQIWTGFIYHGPKLIKQSLKELQ